VTDGTGVPGSVRPGGRTARVRADVLRATGDEIAERGLDGLDLARVAERAGVGKTTVYRRWGNATALVADLLADMAEQSVERSRTGTLRGDLRANAELVVRTLTDPRQGAILRAVIASAASGAGLVDAVHRFYCLRVEEWAGCVRDAIDRGEVPADADPHAVVRAVSAPLYYAMITTACPLDLVAAHQAADAAHAAALAGALACRPTPHPA
jgi:AcrR family transcriptional regulator